MLHDDARIWWEMVTRDRDVATVTWEEFQEWFLENYYNEAIKVAKAEEFMSLVQGETSVMEYSTQFDRLAKFASNLLPTEAARQERFLRGLNPKLEHNVRITLVAGQCTYAQLLKRALTAESAEIRLRQRDYRKSTPPSTGYGKGKGYNDHKRKGPDSQVISGGDKKSQDAASGRQSGGSGRPAPMCAKCNKSHWGDCANRACYKCGMTGHFKKDCPQMRKEEQTNRPNLPALPASRVYNLTKADAEAAEEGED